MYNYFELNTDSELKHRHMYGKYFKCEKQGDIIYLKWIDENEIEYDLKDFRNKYVRYSPKFDALLAKIAETEEIAEKKSTFVSLVSETLVNFNQTEREKY